MPLKPLTGQVDARCSSAPERQEVQSTKSEGAIEAIEVVESAWELNINLGCKLPVGEKRRAKTVALSHGPVVGKRPFRVCGVYRVRDRIMSISQRSILVPGACPQIAKLAMRLR